MAYGREAVATNESIKLRVVITDDAGALVDTDALPVVYIYDSSVDSETMVEEIEARVFTSAYAGPFTSTKLSTGFYEYSYTVPTGAATGVWHDVWVADLEGVNSDEYLQFTVVAGANIKIQSIGNNQLLVVELASTIASDTGTTLKEDTILSYATTYSPFYASPELVRAEAGKYLNWITDATLALLIHWSSREADYISQGPPINRNKHWKFALAKFVVFDTVKRAFMLPGGAAGDTISAGAGGKKQLGELSIQGPTVAGGANAGIANAVMDYVLAQREEWWRVVNAGGNIVPGQGLGPSVAIKGQYDPERRNIGRLWESPDEFTYMQPTSNGKVKYAGRNRGLFSYIRDRRRS